MVITKESKNTTNSKDVVMNTEAQSDLLQVGEVEHNLTSNDVAMPDINDFSDSMELSSPSRLTPLTPRKHEHSATAPRESAYIRAYSTPGEDLPTTTKDKSTAGPLKTSKRLRENTLRPRR